MSNRSTSFRPPHPHSCMAAAVPLIDELFRQRPRTGTALGATHRMNGACS